MGHAAVDKVGCGAGGRSFIYHRHRLRSVLIAVMIVMLMGDMGRVDSGRYMV